jgi:putative membrane protein
VAALAAAEASAVAAEVSVEAAAVSAVAARPEAGETMNAETFFTAEEQRRLRAAVAAAEQKTSGEIVPMIVNSSAAYAEIEVAGLAIGLAIGTLAAFIFHDPFASIQLQLLWPGAGAALGYMVCSIPAVKRRLLPKEWVDSAVDLRSLAAFTAHGLHHTRAHTGILILVSLLEHRVEVLADRGINERVSPGTWDEIVRIVTAGLRSGTACDGFCKAIERCGEILAEYFPRSADDKDELANKLVIES